MCLSTVYEIRDGSENKLSEAVSGIKTDGKTVTLTDIMGVETKVNGSISSIDLIKNTVMIVPES